MENVTENNEVTHEYTSADVLEALKNMDSQYSEEILNEVKVSDLVSIVNSEKSFANYTKMIDTYIAKLEVFNCGLHLLADKLENPTVENVDIMSQYETLDDEEKKQIAIDLYNDEEFQNNLYYITMDIVKQNVPEVTGIFNMLGIDIEKYMGELIRMGKGYKAYIPDGQAENE